MQPKNRLHPYMVGGGRVPMGVFRGGAGAAPPPPNRPRNFCSVEVPNIGKDTWHHTLLLYILENRLPVTGTSLEWFRSYLTDRTHIFTAGLTSTSPLPLFCVFHKVQVWVQLNSSHTLKPLPTFSPITISCTTYLLMTHKVTTAATSLMCQRFYPACRLVSTTWIHFIHHFACSSPHSTTELIWFGFRSNLAMISYCGIFIHPLCLHRAQSWYLTQSYPWSHTSAKLQVRVFPPQKAATTARCSDWWSHEATIVTSLVLSRLDYCNSVLFGLTAPTLAPLQRVQNVAARLVLRLDHRAHIKPALQRLHCDGTNAVQDCHRDARYS